MLKIQPLIDWALKAPDPFTRGAALADLKRYAIENIGQDAESQVKCVINGLLLKAERWRQLNPARMEFIRPKKEEEK